ncbi:hypothetical protein COW36_07255 [bacterium (Candidatus Blackallbacteria) CG17_big_fil_post_rev_8_21_14_2_50_48_46]|uniref:Glutathione S-transferase family protein n=1 Tax=bacterium (Candidatus Blackallbacteria) CG17_big_fil_post_rev_8_21_14_2_50_48_46 TaxID=2014261 RepID=A0A2M7G731_9BACT|nr:MAG: hypothetical protein COW64_06765 [bacterium (Candidatus Blackallbacteria) CG18_big_fil_WC_8_21_14_2_50_49_26]PIW17859.1 MAG: hypothetical protein COW36_07255 [bacterium (Candidatus Blackallbacteria) CG17_big_fil_post_rev_8_21_14_2_50_48_46]PIW48535.1 MAG: hypothetical protein COW20_09210 [bacterium (Candidatus Blackallbacteria) CG13_big_fil_rev_8_21_14_2_50_49_14]
MRKARLFGFLAGGALAGAWAVKNKLEKLAPSVPVVDDDTVLLFQFDYSPYCVKVRHILEYKQIPFQTVEVTPLLHRAFSKRFSGQVKVPYIQHKGQIICDSSQIALYLETEFPEPALLPADPKLREEVLLLEDWLDESFVPALSRPVYVSSYLNPLPLIQNPNLSTGIAALDRFKPQIVPLMLRRNMRIQGLTPADLPKLEDRAQEVLDRAQKLVADKEYLVGESLSLADISLVAHLFNADKLPLLGQSETYRPLLKWRERRLAEIQPA